MKRNFSSIFTIATAISLSLGFVSCSDSNEPEVGEGTMSKENSTLTQPQYDVLSYFVNDVVIDTYSNLATAAIKFNDQVNNLEGDRTQANLDATCEAWRETRKLWEFSEAFLFGTASESQIDPHMDSWPLDNKQLSALLASNTFSGVEDSEERADLLRGNYNNNLMGFHAAEFVIFEDGHSKDIAKITDEGMAYLQAVALVLAEDCCRLKVGWAGTDGLNSREKEIYERIEEDFGIENNYGFFILNTGLTGSIYKGFGATATQILAGFGDIIDEVGNTKMQNPISKGDVLEVESWFSWNSIDDFQNNIRGVKAAYTANNKGKSMHDLIKGKDSELDAKILSNIDVAIEALEGIRTQYGSYRGLIEKEGTGAGNNVNVKKAQDALEVVNTALETAQELEY